MRQNTAKAKLRAGQPVSVINPTYSSAGLVELVGRLGFDVIFIDCEHGPAGWDAVEDMVRAAELVGATPIVRVQANDGPTITRALDRGAGGVQVPHVNTRGEAEATAATPAGARPSARSPPSSRAGPTRRRWSWSCSRRSRRSSTSRRS
jgi:2-keto-3-deoxy-L-rhamnonate aldolase RhmA